MMSDRSMVQINQSQINKNDNQAEQEELNSLLKEEIAKIN
jgi:hypothetical protein